MIIRIPSVAAVLLLFAANPAVVCAQPWTTPRGEGTVSVFYNHSFVQDHFFSLGDRRDVGHIRTHTLTLDVDYGITDRLSLRAALPWVASRYDGDFAHRFPGEAPPLDTMQYNLGLQDFRSEVRYGALEFPVAVAPFVGLILPTHDYEVFGHSAVGLHLTELQVGSYVGAQMSRAYLQGRYAFGFNERVIGRRRNRSVVDLEGGWLVSNRLRLFAFENMQISHGGIELTGAISALPPEEQHDHDALARANHVILGGGASWRTTETMALYGSVVTMVAGANTHATKYGISVGVSWSFGGGLPEHLPPVPRR